ncbi:MAG: YaaA family protein [FCB group bacterium]|nr:YaaA family protein [FCB group bacterium]
MIVLVPPSEGKVKIRKPMELKFEDTDFPLMKEVGQVVRLLSLIDDEDIRSIYGTSKQKALIFHRQNQDVMNSRVWPAIERYSGVVYEHIGWNTLSEEAREYMEKHIRIFSGLFGMVTPMTLIPDYKLKMNVMSLQYHWKPILTDILAKEDMIIDLLPQVHRKAYQSSDNVIEVEFVVMSKGKKKTAGHYGKAVKGEFIRYMAEHNVTSIDQFEGFEYDNFRWDGAMFVKLDD